VSVADVFVSTQWLSEHLNDPAVVAADVRQPFFYQQAHIPGAVSLPLMLLPADSKGVPAAEALARKLGEAGITPETQVIAYDDGASNAAARLFWVLTLYRHSAVSVLDGGITAWRHAGLDWAYEPAGVSPSAYPTPTIDPSVVISTDALEALLGRPDVAIVDTRSPGEYLGLRPTAMRDGHIPGAINVDWTANFREENGIAVKQDPEALRELYRAAGVTPEKQVTLYCASGMRASETFAVLKSLGYPRVALYVPGWNEWGNRDDTPVEDG
jgi:thiosulfate/3-mercaptopyruvate sulfurtransferase